MPDKIYLECKRVPYGKPNMPMEKREYNIVGTRPVGCINEIIEFITGRGDLEYTHLFLSDIDGKYEVSISSGSITQV